MIAVEMLPGERVLDPGDLTDQVTAVGEALDVSISDVTVGVASG